MKHINIIANNITIEPYGIYKINVDMEVEDSEYDSLIYDLERENIVTTKGTKELLGHMSDEECAKYNPEGQRVFMHNGYISGMMEK